METLSEQDEALMEKYLEGEEHSERRSRRHPQRHAWRLVPGPVRIGVQEQGCPAACSTRCSTSFRPARRRRRRRPRCGDEEELMTRKPTRTSRSRPGLQDHADPPLGKLTYVRVYSGIAEPEPRSSTHQGQKERIGKHLPMHANKREEIDAACAGDIVAVMGLKDTTTGDTLCDPDTRRTGVDDLPGAGHPRGDRAEDQVRPGEAGHGHPDARGRGSDVPRRTDEETGQTVIEGWASSTSRVLVDRMKREFKVEANVGKPQVAYRETSPSRSPRSSTRTRSRPVAPDSSAGSSCRRANTKKVAVTCSRTR